MHLTFRNNFAALATGCVVLGACQSTIPNQVLTKPAPVVAPPPVARAAGPWAYRSSTARQQVAIDQRALVTIRTDTISRTDTLTSHSEVSFAFAASGAVSGNVTAFTVQSSAQAAVTPMGLALPFPFRGDYSTGGSQLEFITPRDAAPCVSNPLAVVQSLRDLWFRAPDTLRVGVSWQDSASYVVCRDGVPLHATARRVFRVTAANERDGRIELSVSRNSRTTLDGSGTQFGEPVTIAGTGSGELTYAIDPAGGIIISAAGTAQLDFSLRSRLRTQSVHQTAEIRIGRS